MLAKQQEMRTYLYSYIEEFYMFLKSESTITAYKQHLNHFTNSIFRYDFRFLSLEDLQTINTDTVIRYKGILIKQKLASNTINPRLSALRTFLGYMKFRKLTDYDASADVKYIGNVQKKVKHYDTIPMQAVEQLIEILKKERYLKKEKEWFVKLAVETGLRTKEILNLKQSSFQLLSDGMHVLIKSDEDSIGKGNRDWKELIHIDFFYEMKEDFFTESDNLFTMDESTIRKCIQKKLKQLGYNGNFTNHSLKRTAVINTMDFTKDPRAAQAKGKHANMKTTFDNYIDAVEYGATGYYSMQHKIQKDYISEATHEELLKAIDGLEPNMILLIQAQLQKLKGEI